MIRALIKNLKNVSFTQHFLNPSISSTLISKRFEFTNILESAKKKEDFKFDKLKRYREAEIHLWYSLGFQCIDPKELSDEQWQHLYELDTKHQRKRFCRHLFLKKRAKELKKLLNEQNREAKKDNRERVLAERRAEKHIVYGLGHNSLHIRITSQIMNKWMNIKLHRAKLYGQKVIVDCSYEPFLTDLEKSKVASGLKWVYTDNRKHIKPMDLHLCGVKSNSVIIENLSGQVPSILKKSSPTRLHSECFTELFPKERLVMLTPDSDSILKYDPNDIYVVGGIVDFGRSDPLTFAKAKKLGIRSARLPLDNIRMREGDTRELTMAQTIKIIRECQLNKNMNEIIQQFVKLKSDIRREKERAKEKEKTEKNTVFQ